MTSEKWVYSQIFPRHVGKRRPVRFDFCVAKHRLPSLACSSDFMKWLEVRGASPRLITAVVLESFTCQNLSADVKRIRAYKHVYIYIYIYTYTCVYSIQYMRVNAHLRTHIHVYIYENKYK